MSSCNGSAEEPERLEQVPLLQGVARPVLGRLRSATRSIHLEDGSLLFAEGTRPLDLHLLQSGVVELFSRRRHSEHVMAIILPGEPFVPAAVVADELYLVSARCLGPSRFLTIEAVAFRQAMEEDGVLACRVARMLCAQFRMVQRSLLEMKERTAPRRLAAFLLRLVERCGENGFADLPVPKGSLATRLGMTPECLSRSLGVLKRHGLGIRGNRVALIDRERLAAYCRRDPLLDAEDLRLSLRAL